MTSEPVSVVAWRNVVAKAQWSTGEGGGLESLRPATRRAWFEQHTLPESLRYYTLLTCRHPDRISKALRSSDRKLARLDRRNDGMVLLEDQIIPGSAVIGCLNTDHWAAAVPVARFHLNIAASAVDHNDFPREASVETVTRFVEEDLEGVVMSAVPGFRGEPATPTIHSDANHAGHPRRPSYNR